MCRGKLARVVVFCNIGLLDDEKLLSGRQDSVVKLP